MGSPNIESSVSRPDLRAAVYREWDANGMARAFVADAAMPQLDVDRRSATVKTITREQYLKRIEDAKSPDGGYNRSGYGIGEITYDCVARGHEVPVDDDSAVEMGNYFDAEKEAADVALFKSKMEHEIRVAAMLFNATTFAGYTTSAATVWSNATSATPITDVTLATQAIEGATGGLRPNTLIISGYGWDLLKECDQVTERLAAGSSRDPLIARRETVATILDVNQIIVGSAFYDTTKEGVAASLARCWNKTYALLAYINPRPSLRGSPFMGATLHWTARGSQFGFRFERYREEAKEAEIVKVRRHVVPKVFNAEFGYLISGICA